MSLTIFIYFIVNTPISFIFILILASSARGISKNNQNKIPENTTLTKEELSLCTQDKKILDKIKSETEFAGDTKRTPLLYIYNTKGLSYEIQGALPEEFFDMIPLDYSL